MSSANSPASTIWSDEDEVVSNDGMMSDGEVEMEDVDDKYWSKYSVDLKNGKMSRDLDSAESEALTSELGLAVGNFFAQEDCEAAVEDQNKERQTLKDLFNYRNPKVHVSATTTSKN